MSFFLYFFIFSIIIGITISTPHTETLAITYTYPKAGTTSVTNAVITKYLRLDGTNELTLLFSTNSTFASKLANVSASVNNSTFYVLDSINTGTAAIKGIHYSESSKSTTVVANPAIFPYLKIVVPKVTNKITTLTWSADNEATIS